MKTVGFCEWCGTKGVCSVCGYDQGDGGDSVPLDDPKLEAARQGRISGRNGGGPEDNPHPPGSVLYGWFGGGQLTTKLETAQS